MNCVSVELSQDDSWVRADCEEGVLNKEDMNEVFLHLEKLCFPHLPWEGNIPASSLEVKDLI